MAERAPKLEWSEWPEDSPHVWRIRRATIGSGVHVIDLRATGPNVLDGSFHWDASFMGAGPADSLLAAQLAAEDAALAWLREGVEALAGKVLTGEQVALCVEALDYRGEVLQELGGVHTTQRAATLIKLARELGGGT